MYRGLLRQLVSIGHIEKDPIFQSSNYEIENASDCQKLAYPSAVMSVSSPTGKQPAEYWAKEKIKIAGKKRSGIWRSENLKEGYQKMRALSSRGAFDKYTILVHEGTYFLDLWDISSDGQKRRISIEIIGTKNVRFVHIGNDPTLIGRYDVQIRGNVNVTFKNIMMYQRKPIAAVPIVLNFDGATVNLVDVKMHSPEGACISSLPGEMGPPTVTNLKRCMMTRCWQAFNLLDGSSKIENCKFTKIQTCGNLSSGSLLMTDTFYHFTEGQALFLRLGRVTFENCKLVGSEHYLFNMRKFGNLECIDMKKSELYLLQTSFELMDIVVTCLGSGTKVSARDCHFAQTINLCFSSSLNSDVSVENSKFFCPTILYLALNPKGAVNFEKNICETIPKIVIDGVSSVPQNDFDKINLVKMSQEDEKKLPMYGHQASSKDYSKYNKKFIEDTENGYVLNTRKLLTNPFPALVKKCEYCFRGEMETVMLGEGRKFKYCQKCKLVCYCSAECQKTDWRDHKLICDKLVVKDLFKQ